MTLLSLYNVTDMSVFRADYLVLDNQMAYFSLGKMTSPAHIYNVTVIAEAQESCRREGEKTLKTRRTLSLL